MKPLVRVRAKFEMVIHSDAPETRLAGQFCKVRDLPAFVFEIVEPSTWLHAIESAFVERDAVAAPTERLVPVVSVFQIVFDLLAVGPHLKDHRYGFVNWKIVEPSIAGAPRSERCHRQRSVGKQCFLEFQHHRTIKWPLRKV